MGVQIINPLILQLRQQRTIFPTSCCIDPAVVATTVPRCRCVCWTFAMYVANSPAGRARKNKNDNFYLASSQFLIEGGTLPSPFIPLLVVFIGGPKYTNPRMQWAKLRGSQMQKDTDIFTIKKAIIVLQWLPTLGNEAFERHWNPKMTYYFPPSVPKIVRESPTRANPPRWPRGNQKQPSPYRLRKNLHILKKYA